MKCPHCGGLHPDPQAPQLDGSLIVCSDCINVSALWGSELRLLTDQERESVNSDIELQEALRGLRRTRKREIQ